MVNHKTLELLNRPLDFQSNEILFIIFSLKMFRHAANSNLKFCHLRNLLNKFYLLSKTRFWDFIFNSKKL